MHDNSTCKSACKNEYTCVCVCVCAYLRGDHVKVEFLLLHKLRVSSHLHNFTVVHAHDAVGVLNSRQPAHRQTNSKKKEYTRTSNSNQIIRIEIRKFHFRMRDAHFIFGHTLFLGKHDQANVYSLAFLPTCEQ